jgi:glycerophosphoryl diester phosphodiesterase
VAAFPAVPQRPAPWAAGPVVIGHRGACGYRPEHTLASYELGARMGADILDVDLVSTADGVLVCRHDNEISLTTDVAAHPELADRRTTRTVDGVALSGWFTEDLTLAEVRSLRAVERLPRLRPGNTAYDGLWQVPTFEEVLALRERLSAELGREVGLSPETKHPTTSASLGLPLEEPLLAALEGAGLAGEGCPVLVQSFETTGLRALHAADPALALLQLVMAAGAPWDLVAAGDPRTYADLLAPEGLREVAAYATVLAPDKAQLQVRGRAAATALVDDAHAAGLRVVPYTLRSENAFLPADLRVGDDPAGQGRALEEQRLLWEAGVDGLFTDEPDVGVESRRRWLDDHGR